MVDLTVKALVDALEELQKLTPDVPLSISPTMIWISDYAAKMAIRRGKRKRWRDAKRKGLTTGLRIAQ